MLSNPIWSFSSGSWQLFSYIYISMFLNILKPSLIYRSCNDEITYNIIKPRLFLYQDFKRKQNADIHLMGVHGLTKEDLEALGR